MKTSIGKILVSALGTATMGRSAIGAFGSY